jgi:hypothetical protein
MSSIAGAAGKMTSSAAQAGAATNAAMSLGLANQFKGLQDKPMNWGMFTNPFASSTTNSMTQYSGANPLEYLP